MTPDPAPSSDGAAAPRQLDVFIHIPKTAGTTVSRVLRSSTPSSHTHNVFKGEGGRTDPRYARVVENLIATPEVALVAGHTPLGIADFFPDDWRVRFVTFLRDPVDRVISHYFQVVETEKEGPRFATHEGADGLPLASIASLSYDDAIGHEDYVIDNLQTRMLSGDRRPFGEVDEGMLERALHNLETRIHAIGLAERLEESIVILQRRLGQRPMAFDDRRVNPGRPRGAEVPEALRRAAVRASAADDVLHRRAQVLFDEYPELREPEVVVDVAALRRSRAASDAAADAEPPAWFDGGPRAWELLLDSRVELLRERQRYAQARNQVAALQASLRTLPAELEVARSQAERARAKSAETSAKLARARRGGGARSSPHRSAGLQHQILDGPAGANRLVVVLPRLRRDARPKMDAPLGSALVGVGHVLLVNGDFGDLLGPLRETAEPSAMARLVAEVAEARGVPLSAVSLVGRQFGGAVALWSASHLPVGHVLVGRTPVRLARFLEPLVDEQALDRLGLGDEKRRIGLDRAVSVGLRRVSHPMVVDLFLDGDADVVSDMTRLGAAMVGHATIECNLVQASSEHPDMVAFALTRLGELTVGSLADG